MPQKVEREEMNRREEAQPPSSLLVDEFVSEGPSTGPEHLYRTVVPVLSNQPWVAELSPRPPSEAR
jgi:hypothetical protein